MKTKKKKYVNSRVIVKYKIKPKNFHPDQCDVQLIYSFFNTILNPGGRKHARTSQFNHPKYLNI